MITQKDKIIHRNKKIEKNLKTNIVFLFQYPDGGINRLNKLKKCFKEKNLVIKFTKNKHLKKKLQKVPQVKYLALLHYHLLLRQQKKK